MADLRSYINGYDLDSGGGTDYNQGTAIVVAASGGAVLIGGDATNGLDVDVTRVTGTVTVDSELPAAAALADNTANPTVPGVGAFLMLWDGAAWDRAPGTSAAGLSVTVQNASLVVDTELTAVAALADATANPTISSLSSYLMGFNGTTWDRIRTANTGRLQVDVITGGGTETPTTPTVSAVTSAALAAGATIALNSAEAAAMKLRKVIVWASVAFKATLHTVDNAVESAVKAYAGGQPFMPWTFDAPHRNYITLGTTAGADNFRVNVTSLDDANAADVYCSFFYEA